MRPIDTIDAYDLIQGTERRRLKALFNEVLRDKCDGKCLDNEAERNLIADELVRALCKA